jgi:predicted RNase H-like nuclease (RuvC/YqgF family)
MPRVLHVVVSVCVFASATPAFAQGTASADEKEIAAYTLTMPTLNKVVATMRSMAQEMMQDPKYQQVMKIDKQIEDVEAQVAKLEAKNEMTEADGKKVEALNEQLEKLRSQKEQIEDTIDSDNPMGSDPKSLTEMEQNIRKVPAFARALEREGLSPREFSKFMLAMLQAGMVHGFSQGKVDYSKLPPGINPDNVKFIAEHEAELKALEKEFAALGKKN